MVCDDGFSFIFPTYAPYFFQRDMCGEKYGKEGKLKEGNRGKDANGQYVHYAEIWRYSWLNLLCQK